MKPLLVCVAVLALAACQKTAPAPAAPAQNPPAAATAAAPDAAAANPPKMEKMICRNSQTGAKAECGTPGAVMVGMEPQ